MWIFKNNFLRPANLKVTYISVHTYINRQFRNLLPTKGIINHRCSIGLLYMVK